MEKFQLSMVKFSHILPGLAFVIVSIGLEAREYPALLTGEVFSRTAQDIFVPHISTWRANISLMVPEGQQVQSGDLVVAFDGTSTMSELEQHKGQQRAQQAVADRDLARLDKELTQAWFLVEQCKVALELAELKAEIPKGLIGAIEHAENQLAKEQGIKQLNDAFKLLEEKQQGLEAMQQQVRLDQRKAELKEAWLTETLARLSVEATQPGYVIHSNHPWTRAKFQEGDTVRTSFKVAEVADTSDLAIRVWVNAVDRPHLQVNAPVTIFFDAMPDNPLAGHLQDISDSATKRLDWGKAAYYEGTVSFNIDQAPGLLPGMSALVEVQ
jgi:multidrug resistance efflux pump